MKMNRRSFMTGSAALGAAPGLPVSFGGTHAALTGNRRAPMHRCLFLDDVHIDRAEGLEVRGHPAKRYTGNPLFVQKFPWETAFLVVYGHCIVYNPERKLYQMFYLVQPKPGPYLNVLHVGGVMKKKGGGSLPAYAESTDGIHWERPLRKDVAFNDVAETNLLDLEDGQSFEPGVLWDGHDPDPDKRYKAFIWDQHFRVDPPGKLEYRRAAPSLAFPRGLIISRIVRDESGKILYEDPYNNYGIRVAFSPDGIHWKKHPGWVIRCYSDTGQSVLYDSRLGKYVAFGRFNQQKDSPAYYVGRSVSRVESTDFIHWSEPELVLTGDSQDPESFQINSMPTDFYEGLYIGIMEEIRKRSERKDARPLPDTPIWHNIQLAVSRDGRHWTRVANRCPFIEGPTPGTWDAYKGAEPRGFIRPAAGLFIYGDQVRMYYSDGKGSDSGLGIGMATWRRDGFVSLHAGPEGGELLTRAFIPTSPELHLNIDASQGEATVRMGDFQGRPLEGWKIDQPSEPIRGDQLDTIVRWAASDFGQRVGKATTLRIKMRNADLYSFWTE